MGELLERAFTEQRLLDAWREVRDAGTGAQSSHGFGATTAVPGRNDDG
jgi:hypothetical protein